MKAKFYALALSFLGLTSSTLAQDLRSTLANGKATPGRQCATMDVLKAQMAADPSLAKRMAAVEDQTKKFEATSTARRSTTGVITIPVVVHVLYNVEAQNVSDAQVAAQITVLNKDFAKANADARLIPAAFAPLAVNTNIQFVLAKQDPTGAQTTGIIHKQTKITSFTTNDVVKFSKRGGDDAWPASNYLNLWVCNLGGGLLGYAQFPGGKANTDGVVVLYSSLPGGSSVSYNKGRTATHEVGHWLNLRHIWGDTNCGNDLVADTPTQQTSNYGCPDYPHITCNNKGDMSMNYMDYTDDACMYMFSAGQAARMNALFDTGGSRASLLNSPAARAASQLAISSELASKAVIHLYPNPASQTLNVSVPEKQATTWSVKVYDLSGYEMKQAHYDGQGRVGVANLPQGLYQVVMSDGAQTIRQRFQKE
ncbi:M43 family zinc metalloprotease [Hymenobacter volaticus]|uniref:M43 family zinc metalloprotease n=1 Tax=Hymenobacter volaticus TaxID=2932254 RepID=A0ABY4G4Y9_9BACT|nr:M43 family zinc metalloprotease [Hymenobacter volaticus]UOQ65916.1 M43 family zinc metalloprotease [Hymenobacter volaticus]